MTFVPHTTTTIDVSKLEPISPSPSPSPVPQVQPPSIRPPDPFQEGVCEDDEDLYFSRPVLSGETEAPCLPQTRFHISANILQALRVRKATTKAHTPKRQPTSFNTHSGLPMSKTLLRRRSRLPNTSPRDRIAPMLGGVRKGWKGSTRSNVRSRCRRAIQGSGTLDQD